MFPIIQKLGGIESARGKLKAKGLTLKTARAIDMWFRRGRIPGDATRLLMEIAEGEKLEYTSADFVVPSVEEGRAA